MPFIPRSIELVGGFTLPLGADAAFGLFSPLGETEWVPGWRPELLFPPGVTWARGLLFKTAEERGEAIWVVTALDPERHHVEYHRIEVGRYVARVLVRCSPIGHGETSVDVAYTFVGISDIGNADIASMSQAAFDDKMRRWRGWIVALRPEAR